MTFREHNQGKARPRNKKRACILNWPNGEQEPVAYIAPCGTGHAIVERDDLDDDGNRERIEVMVSQLEWR